MLALKRTAVFRFMLTVAPPPVMLRPQWPRGPEVTRFRGNGPLPRRLGIRAVEQLARLVQLKFQRAPPPQQSVSAVLPAQANTLSRCQSKQKAWRWIHTSSRQHRAFQRNVPPPPRVDRRPLAPPSGGRWREGGVTFRALGFLWASLYRSSEARCVLLRTRSSDGPISSSSILGVLQPDFFSRDLQQRQRRRRVSRLQLYAGWAEPCDTPTYL